MKKVRYVPEVVEDRRDLDTREWEEIRNRIEELREKGPDHSDVKLIPHTDLEHPVWQLTVDDENTDRRVFFDLESDTVVILAVWDPGFTHSGDKHWRELRDRM